MYLKSTVRAPVLNISTASTKKKKHIAIKKKCDFGDTDICSGRIIDCVITNRRQILQNKTNRGQANELPEAAMLFNAKATVA